MRPTGPKQPDFTSDAHDNTFRHAPTAGSLAPWVIDGTYDVTDGRLRVTSLTIHPSEPSIPPNGITGAVLRSIHPAQYTDRLKTSESGYLRWLEDGLARTDPEVAESYPNSVQAIEAMIAEVRSMVGAPRSGPTGVRGAPRLDDNHLRRVARLHKAQIEDDGTYGSVKRLAEELDQPYDTVKDWIAKARKRGLYPLLEEPTTKKGQD